MQWQEIKKNENEESTSEVVRFDKEGTTFEGVYKETVQYSNENRSGNFYRFTGLENENEEYIIFPTVVLETKFKDILPESIIKIEYIGLKQSRMNPLFKYKDYKVYIAIEE